MNYIRHNFFYVLCSFSHIRYSFCDVWERTSDYGFAEIVGAYCIRPARHRLIRTANHHRDTANRRNSGRMQYAPTAVQFFHFLHFVIYKGVLLTPFASSPEPCLQTVKSCPDIKWFLYPPIHISLRPWRSFCHLRFAPCRAVVAVCDNNPHAKPCRADYND